MTEEEKEEADKQNKLSAEHPGKCRGEVHHFTTVKPAEYAASTPEG